MIPTPESTPGDALNEYLRRELPGCEYRVDDKPNEMLMTLQVRGPRLFAGAHLDDLIALDSRHLAAMAENIVHELRRRAIDAFGLAAELGRARDEARKAGRDEVQAQLKAKLDRMRDESWVVPGWVSPAADWIRTALDELPELEVRQSTDTGELEAAANRIRQAELYGSLRRPPRTY